VTFSRVILKDYLSFSTWHPQHLVRWISHNLSLYLCHLVVPVLKSVSVVLLGIFQTPKTSGENIFGVESESQFCTELLTLLSCVSDICQFMELFIIFEQWMRLALEVFLQPNTFLKPIKHL